MKILSLQEDKCYDQGLHINQKSTWDLDLEFNLELLQPENQYSV
jgi:hypothetical protein